MWRTANMWNCTNVDQNLNALKPQWGKAKIRNQKAFYISSLSKMWGSFRWCKHFAICWTRRKLSWILLPLTKADWFTGTKSGSMGARRLAMSLATSLAKLWIRLMGQKSHLDGTDLLRQKGDEQSWEVWVWTHDHDDQLRELAAGPLW